MVTLTGTVMVTLSVKRPFMFSLISELSRSRPATLSDTRCRRVPFYVDGERGRQFKTSGSSHQFNAEKRSQATVAWITKW